MLNVITSTQNIKRCDDFFVTINIKVKENCRNLTSEESFKRSVSQCNRETKNYYYEGLVSVKDT